MGWLGSHSIKITAVTGGKVLFTSFLVFHAFFHGQGPSRGVLDSDSSQWLAPFPGFSCGIDPCPWLALPNVLYEMPDGQKTMPSSCEPEPAVRTEPERQHGELSIGCQKGHRRAHMVK